MTAWIVVTVVSKSSTSVLIDTFMTDWSRTITNCAVPRASKGSQRFTGSHNFFEAASSVDGPRTRPSEFRTGRQDERRVVEAALGIVSKALQICLARLA